MFDINDETLHLIKKASRGKAHLKLTIGYILDNHSVIKVFNESGEHNTSIKYHYEIGSITKTFTTSLLSKYVFENKVSLSDSIQMYIEKLQGENDYPSLLRLATHSSGYGASLPLNNWQYLNLFLDLIKGSGDINKNNPLSMDYNKMKQLIEQTKLKVKDYPWKYSNFGIGLIGYVLGVISGKGYWNTMNDYLQHELGLNNTYLGTSNNNLQGYDRKNNKCGNWQWNEDNLISPAGALSSTADDLLQYAKIIMDESRPYLPLSYQKHSNGTKKYDMGLGWWLLKKNNHVMLHGGGTGCFSTFLVIDKEKKVAAVVLANYRLSKNVDEKIGMSILESLQKTKNS